MTSIFLSAKNVDMGGYTLWSEPVTANPLSRIAAATDAMAVPQIPVNCTDLMDDESRPCEDKGIGPRGKREVQPLGLTKGMLSNGRAEIGD